MIDSPGEEVTGCPERAPAGGLNGPVDFWGERPDICLVHLVPEELARRHGLVPLRVDPDGVLEVLTHRPDLEIERLIALVTGAPVRLRIASRGTLEGLLDAYYSRVVALPPESQHGTAEQTEWAPQAVHAIARGAQRAGASDVHLEPEGDEVIVRYRIDGVLHDAGRFPAARYRNVLNRIRVLAGISTADGGTPQSGKITLAQPGGSETDLRVSVLPAGGGPRVTLRVLDRSLALHGLEDLGFTSGSLDRYRKDIVNKPYGMVLVAGPTGSGKTTTLYNTVREFDRISVNVVALEDPVEYSLSRTTQVQVNRGRGLTFASGLRSLLRHDPDVIIVGEIRDAETARIAAQAALTGHKVLSSLHAMDAISALFRLVEMGAQPHLLPDAVSGVVAQRLVRRVCGECREEYVPGEVEHRWFCQAGLARSMPETLVRSSSGCSACAGTGHMGRVGVFEVLPLDSELGAMIAGGASRREALQLAVRSGLETLKRAALLRVVQRDTTMEEVMRVIHA